jgi:hypothetical protein
VGCTLDQTLERQRQLAYLRIPELFDEDGNLRPVGEWPEVVLDHLSGFVALINAIRQANEALLTFFRHKGEYGGPPPDARNLTINQQNITVVPVEKLTDAELAFYAGLLKSGRATRLEPAPAEPAKGK